MARRVRLELQSRQASQALLECVGARRLILPVGVDGTEIAESLTYVTGLHGDREESHAQS